MIRIEQLKVKNDPSVMRRLPDSLTGKAARFLGTAPGEIERIEVVRHSIDARKKPEIMDVYTLDVLLRDESAVLAHVSGRNRDKISIAAEQPQREIPMPGSMVMKGRPVVAGAGPAGLFAAYTLASAGYRPVVLERGDDTADRDRNVSRFWETGQLDPESNIQFGLGGAGTYSDGKLYTGINDRYGYVTQVLRMFARFGAPEDILYEAHPHIGTDVLKTVISGMRDGIVEAGGEFRFRTRLTGPVFDSSGRLAGYSTDEGQAGAGVLILALGHSARDTIKALAASGVGMEQKPFAAGFRVAHRQSIIDSSQYGTLSGPGLPPAIYKLTGKAGDGRGVYSFCMCPGGQIINASSEQGYTCVNGMSGSRRDGLYANSAIVIQITPEDYCVSGDPTEGIEFQRSLEKRAFELGRGCIPVSSFSRFVQAAGGDPGKLYYIPAGAEEQAFCGRISEADLSGILPEHLNRDIIGCMSFFGRKIRGFDAGDAIFAGVESRTSSPVRITRGDDGTAPGHEGLYPCGEGAGYAGGIVSAAVDGIKTAEHIIRKYERPGEQY